MDPKAIIDSYVGDVVRYLPRRQRTDVALELRSLLDDELAGRAAEAGREPDAPMTMELLTTFGVPQDVADRYRPEGFTIIRPSNAPRFTWLALGGIVVIWAVSLPAYLLGAIPVVGWDYGADQWWGRLTAWWFGPGLGAFWWPGAMITFTLLDALANRRRQSSPKPWAPPAAPRTIDRDLVSRPGMVLTLVFGLLGASVLIAVPFLGLWAPGLPRPLLDALQQDTGFLGSRAPWALPLGVAYLAFGIVLLINGRWNPLLHRIRGILDLASVALLAWWVLGGQIFVSPEADNTAKFFLVAFALYAVVDAVLAFRRSLITTRRP